MDTVNKIIALLKEKNKTQKELTDFLKLDKSTFSQWKSGKSTSYTKYYYEIAEFLGVPVSSLVNDRIAKVVDKCFDALEKGEIRLYDVALEPPEQTARRARQMMEEKEKSPPHGTKDFFRDLFSDLTESEVDDLTKYARFLRYLRDHPEV